MPMPPNAAAAGMPTGQPPTGSSPATSPVPNKGLEAAGMAKLGLVIRQLETIVPLLGAGTEAGRDVLKALTSLSKHVPPGAVSPGVEKSAMDQMQLKMKQQTPQLPLSLPSITLPLQRRAHLNPMVPTVYACRERKFKRPSTSQTRCTVLSFSMCK